MPEIKNTFLKSRMNKDVDARLLPNGEYRDALNIGINTSEGSDIGALENILGNIQVADFGLSTSCNLQVIGTCVDEVNERLFVFITNFHDGSLNQLSNFQTGGESYICMYDASNNIQQILVSGTFLNFSLTHLITGVNVLEQFLFWTDNRNQPRKINIENAIANSSYYTREEQISVAKIAPISPIKLYKTFTGTTVSTMVDTVSTTLPNGDVSPYYDAGWEGDEDFLKEKFVRFSYRFKFDDNEYSLMAPFTQIAFIPEQDGYFIDNATQEDMNKTYTGTDVDFMVNKVTQFLLQIPSPGGLGNPDVWANMFDAFHITDVDILMKESNSSNISVITTINKSFFGSVASNDFEYVYNSNKPYKILPSSEITRVSDVVPIRAKAQDITANRVIYGNYINRHATPSSLNYTTSFGAKGAESGFESDKIEYPNHTIKQNRSYQIGVVVQDAFGRQSNVMLSSQDTPNTQASTIHVPYRTASSTPPLVNNAVGLTPANTWMGDNLQINFLSKIPTELPNLEGYPGIGSNLNPLGYVNYRIVVKQSEQDYYNIYFPGILNGYTDPDGSAGAAASLANPTVHFVLHGDNIDKVPRDLTQLGPDQRIFRSSENSNIEMPSIPASDAQWFSTQPEGEEVSDYFALQDRKYRERLNKAGENASLDIFLRVNTDYSGSGTTMINKQHFFTVSKKPDNVTSIGTLNDLGLFDYADLNKIAASHPVYYDYQAKPLIAQVTAQKDSALAPYITIGETATNAYPFLGVYETQPNESALDIFWETTSTGDIATLNTAINNEDNVSVFNILDATSPAIPPPGPISRLYENYDGTTSPINATETFRLVNSTNVTLTTATATLTSVVDGFGSNVTSKFSLNSIGLGVFQLQMTSTVASVGTRADELTVTLSCNSSGIITEKAFDINILNRQTVPIAPPSAGTVPISSSRTSLASLYEIIGENGSASTTQHGENMYFFINSQVDSGGNPVDFFFLNDQGINSSNQATIKLYHKEMTSAETGVYTLQILMRDRPLPVPSTMYYLLNFSITIT